MPKLKVLQVIDTLGMGGAETWLMEVLRLWSKTGVGQMDFLLTSGNRGIFDLEAQQLGAKLHYLQFCRANASQFLTEFRRILAAENYDAIHDHQDFAGGWHFLMGTGVSPPVRVVHLHNPTLHIAANYATSPSRKFVAWMGRRLVNALATHVCGTSEEILRSYGFDPQHAGRPEIFALHCGIDTSLFNGETEFDRDAVLKEFGWTPDVKLVLFAGRLDRDNAFPHPRNHKNSWFALNVVRAAIQQDASLRFLMAGFADPVREELNRRICEWGLEGKLQLAGVRRDIPRLMRAADVLLFPSAQEGLGMVAVEAQAAGLPVLASTAVPHEAIVIPQLYDSISLQDPLSVWAKGLLDRIAKPRPALQLCRDTFERSAFSIVNSARSLEEIYGARSA